MTLTTSSGIAIYLLNFGHIYVWKMKMSNWKWSALKLSDSVKGEVKRVKYVEFDFAIKITGNAPASSNGYR